MNSQNSPFHKNIFFQSILACLLSLFCISKIAFADTPKRGMTFHGTLTTESASVLKTWNVNVVRYTLIWGNPEALDSSDETSYLTWLQSALDEFDLNLPYLEAQGIKVVLNLHSPPGGFSSRGNIAAHRIFANATHQATFIKAWQMIANRYKDNSTIWAFDLLNEPAEAKKPPKNVMDWNHLAQSTADAIRAIDTTHPLIMTPVYGKLTRVSTMKKLKASNVIYTIHFYTPFKFIHQGVLGVPYGATYPTKKDTLASLTKSLSGLRAFQRKNKARIYIGEFSVARWAPKGSGAHYLGDITKLFNRLGFDWTYHAFRDASIWDLEAVSKKNSNAISPTPTDRLKQMLKAWAKNKF